MKKRLLIAGLVIAITALAISLAIQLRHEPGERSLSHREMWKSGKWTWALNIRVELLSFIPMKD